MVIRAVQQRSAIIQKPLRRQAHQARHRQASVAGQLHKCLPLLRRDTNFEASVIDQHARSLAGLQKSAQRTLPHVAQASASAYI